MDCLAPKDGDLKRPLFPKGPKKAEARCCAGYCAHNQGYMIWNGVLLIMGAIFVTEAGFCFAAGLRDPPTAAPVAPPADAAAAAAAISTPTYALADVEMAVGISLFAVGATQIGIAFVGLMGCCDADRINGGALSTVAHAAYFTVSSLVIATEVVLALAMFVLQDWDNFKHSFNLSITETAADARARKDMNLVLLGFMIELILGVFVQVGAMVFHVTYANLNKDDTLEILATGSQDSYGSESFTEKRLDHMRKYYAQLYVENGLKIPKELQGHGQ